MKYKIEIKGLNQFAAKIGNPPVKRVFTGAMDLATRELQSNARAEITEKGTTYRGQLQAKIARKVTPFRSEVGVNLPYAGVIETGKRSGRQPPSAPLEKWAQVKLGTKGLGFVIARKIKQRGGIVGKNPFMETSFEKSKGYIDRVFKAAHRKLVKGLS